MIPSSKILPFNFSEFLVHKNYKCYSTAMINLLDFYADWCGPCKAIKPILGKLEEDMGDKVTVTRVDVDEDQAKAREYNVMSIPTLVLVKDGKEIDRKIGLVALETLKSWVELHL